MLTAPIDGIVQQLVVHTIGGVVTPTQPLAVVVPRDREIEIETMVSNRDMRLISAGQDAEIKVDAFNFTRHGLVHGRVHSVSRDTTAPDRRDRNWSKMGASYSSAHRWRSRAGRPASVRHGRYGRDQDRLASHHQLPAFPTPTLQAGSSARKIETRAHGASASEQHCAIRLFARDRRGGPARRVGEFPCRAGMPVTTDIKMGAQTILN